MKLINTYVESWERGGEEGDIEKEIQREITQITILGFKRGIIISNPMDPKKMLKGILQQHYTNNF